MLKIGSKKPSKELVDKIETELIEPTYYRDIKYNIWGKSSLKLVSDISEILSQVLLGMSVVFAFSAGFFNLLVLAYVSGCLGTCSTVLSKFSSYTKSESKERTEQVNIILEKLGIEEIPDIILNASNPTINVDNVDHINNNSIHPINADQSVDSANKWNLKNEEKNSDHTIKIEEDK